MADKAAEVAALGGSRPADTGTSAADVGPTGGGLAVPTDKALMGGTDSLGDTAGMDDGGGLPGAVSTRDTLATEAGAAAGPKVAPAGASSNDNGDAPTGGLSGAGTVGMGDKGG